MVTQKADVRSAEANAYRSWYGTARWRKIAKAQLDDDPLCCMCKPRVTPATVADHVKPHRGNATLFWYGELQSLCSAHHSATKQREEKRGHAIGSTADGRPRDPEHPWNR